MQRFIKSILENEGFKKSYIDELLKDPIFLDSSDLSFYNRSKARSQRKTRLFKKLGLKSFTKQSENYWLYRGYNKIESRDLANSNIKPINRYTPMQIEFWINKGMSTEEADFKIKSSRKTQKEYWIAKGFNEEEAIVNMKEYQKANVEKMLEHKKSFPELYKDTFWTQKEHWIKKGLSEEEAISKVSELQKTFSLDICIKKYGKIEGEKIWKKRQDKWLSKVFNENTCISKGTSSLSNSFISILLENIKHINGTFLYDKNEKFIYSKERKRVFKYDFTFLEHKKIIEINGDFWHANPDYYKDDTLLHKVSKKRICDIREMDSYKKNLAISYGYEILIIWENEIRNNQESALEKCIKFLNN